MPPPRKGKLTVDCINKILTFLLRSTDDGFDWLAMLRNRVEAITQVGEYVLEKTDILYCFPSFLPKFTPKLGEYGKIRQF